MVDDVPLPPPLIKKKKERKKTENARKLTSGLLDKTRESMERKGGRERERWEREREREIESFSIDFLFNVSSIVGERGRVIQT